MKSVSQSINSFIKNSLGFKTKRRIVVIESDDWGSIRMPSTDAYKILVSKGIVKPINRYDAFDSLANQIDLERLFEVIHSVKDINGNGAKFTPISVLANPDFQKIKESDFKTYHYKLFTETLLLGGEEGVLSLWKEGIQGGYFVPQYHGREHLNVNKWMRALKNGHEQTMEAFEHGVYGITFDSEYIEEDNYLAAYDFFDPTEIEILKEITTDGLIQFEKIFGFRASYFVPPNGPLSSQLHSHLNKCGITGLQTARMVYKEPIGFGGIKKRLRYFGKKTGFGNQLFTLRNATFEPSEKVSFDWKEKCLSDIEIAFRYNKPAIISSHRVNFMGRLVPQNRKDSLLQLEELLRTMLKKWPNIEFMTSGELMELMINSK